QFADIDPHFEGGAVGPDVGTLEIQKTEEFDVFHVWWIVRCNCPSQDADAGRIARAALRTPVSALSE
ncbi:hypothetical protein ABTK05_22380, partial [Acinetobacter baumannii]